MGDFRGFLERIGVSGDEYEKMYLKIKQMKYEPLMEMMIKFNGRPYESFYQFLDGKMKALELVFTAPKKWGEWHFDDPVMGIRILPNGLGSIQVLDGEINPQRWMLEKPPFQKAMVRMIILRSHVEGGFGLLTPEKMFSLLKRGVVPYVVRIVAYTKQRRYKVDINLVTNEVIADFRGGKIPPKLRVRRSVQEYFIFDKVYSSLNIPYFPKMFFEAIFESNGLDEEILSLIFNVSPAIIKNNVGVLIKHNVVEYSESTGKYTVRLPMQVR